MNINDWWKHRILDLGIIFAVALIPLLWFPKGYMITSQDAAYPVNILENFKSKLFTWNGQEPFGRDYSYNMGSITIHGVEAGFKLMGLSVFGAQKLTFIFWFFMMGVSMYYCAYSFRKHFPYRYFPLLSAIIYSVNFYLLAIWRQGAGTTFSAYTALPLIASFYIRFITGEMSVLLAGLLISLVLFLFNAGGGLSIPLFGGLLIILTTATIYFILLQGRQEGVLRMMMRIIRLAILSFILSLVLNAYWILPFLSFAFINYHSSVASQVVLSGARAWMDSVSGYTSMINLFRLQGFPDWYNNATHSYSSFFLQNPLFIIISFLFPLTAYLSLVVVKEHKQKKYLVFFVLVSLVALFFSAGTHKPLGFIMGFMVDYIPGFSIFRSAQYKFISALYFSYALLISYTVNVVIEHMKEGNIWFAQITSFTKRLFVIIVMLVVVLYHFPYFTTDFFVWAKPLTLLLKIPDYVLAFKSWSDTNLSYDERLFIAPRLNTVWKTEVYTWNYFSPYSLINLITDKPIVENVSALASIETAFVDRLYQELMNGNTAFVARLTSLLQTPYLLYRGDANYTLDWVPSENPTDFLTALERLPEVKLVWNRGSWNVYQLPLDRKFAGRIYGLNSLTKYTGSDEDSIGALVAGSNNFVRESDLKTDYLSDVRAKVSVSGAIFASSCASCVLEKEVTSPVIFPVRLLPGSFLYFIKTWKERKLESSTLSVQDLFGNRLGLSIVRTMELMKLIERDRDIRMISQTGERLKDYWDAIGSSFDLENLNKLTDFSLLALLRNYVTYEESILIGAYNDGKFTSGANRPFVHEELAKILQPIQLIFARINKFIANNEWSSVKVYDVPKGATITQVYLDALSLGSPTRLPSSIIIGNDTHSIKPIVNENKVMLGEHDLSGVSYVTLVFPQVINVLSEMRPVTDNYPTWGQRCVMADVHDFTWQKKYKIRLAEASTPKGIQFFIRKKNVISQNADSSLSGYTVPNYAFNLEAQKNQDIKTFYFNGSDGDTAVALYICSNGPENPAAIMKNVTVEELIQPSIYFIPVTQSQVASPMHQLSFERIDSTKYIIRNPSPLWPRILVFNERFNPGWRLYNFDKTRIRRMPWTKEFWIEAQAFNPHHFRIYGFANAWYIDTVPTGDLILEYYPQTLYYRGIVLSIIGLFIVMGGLVIYKRVSKHYEVS